MIRSSKTTDDELFERFDSDDALRSLAQSDEYLGEVNTRYVDVMSRTLTDAVLTWGSALGMGCVVEVLEDVSSDIAAVSEAGLVSGLQPAATDCVRNLRISLQAQMTRAAVLWTAYVALDRGVGAGFDRVPDALFARALDLAEWAESVHMPDGVGFDEIVAATTERLAAEIVLGTTDVETGDGGESS